MENGRVKIGRLKTIILARNGACFLSLTHAPCANFPVPKIFIPFVCLFQMGSYIVKAGLELAIQIRITLTSSSCLHLSSALRLHAYTTTSSVPLPFCVCVCVCFFACVLAFKHVIKLFVKCLHVMIILYLVWLPYSCRYL